MSSDKPPPHPNGEPKTKMATSENTNGSAAIAPREKRRVLFRISTSSMTDEEVSPTTSPVQSPVSSSTASGVLPGPAFEDMDDLGVVAEEGEVFVEDKKRSGMRRGGAKVHPR